MKQTERRSDKHERTSCTSACQRCHMSQLSIAFPATSLAVGFTTRQSHMLKLPGAQGGWSTLRSEQFWWKRLVVHSSTACSEGANMC